MVSGYTNTANGITPESVRKSIADIIQSPYERDHVIVDIGNAKDGKPLIGHNLRAHIADLDEKPATVVMLGWQARSK